MPPPKLVFIRLGELRKRHTLVVNGSWAKRCAVKHTILHINLIVWILATNVSHRKNWELVRWRINRWVFDFKPKLNRAFRLPHVKTRRVKSEEAVFGGKVNSQVIVITGDAIKQRLCFKCSGSRVRWLALEEVQIVLLRRCYVKIFIRSRVLNLAFWRQVVFRKACVENAVLLCPFNLNGVLAKDRFGWTEHDVVNVAVEWAEEAGFV